MSDDLESSLYDWDEQVYEGQRGNEKRLEDDQNILRAPVKEKKLSRIEKHKTEITDYECDWEKFPKTVKNWARRRDRNQKQPYDFEFAFKMAIVDEKYPNVLLKQDMVYPLLNEIFSMLYLRPCVKIGIGIVLHGALRVNCFGSKAVEWLEELDGLLIGGITVKVLEADQLLRGLDSSLDGCKQEKQRPNRIKRDTKLLKMAIVSDNYPHLPIEQYMVPAIQSVINEAIGLTTNIIPAIFISQIVDGALCIDCEDADSANWLKGIEGEYVNGITLKVINAADLPKPVKMAWTTKKQWTDTPKMLEYLQRWNKKLRTCDWQILYTSISGYYLRRVVLMDPVSADVIKTAKYNLFTGVEFTRFRLLENKDSTTSKISAVRRIPAAKVCESDPMLINQKVSKKETTPTTSSSQSMALCKFVDAPQSDNYQMHSKPTDSVLPGILQEQEPLSCPAPYPNMHATEGDTGLERGPSDSRKDNRSMRLSVPPQLKSTYNKLSGAGRKRLLRLWKSGLTMEEAIPLALEAYQGSNPFPGLTDKTEETFPKEKPGNVPSTSTMPEEPVEPLSSYKNVAGAVKVGIKNSEPMTAEQMELVYTAITTTICLEARRWEHSKLGQGPSFGSISHQSGWLLAMCDNEYTKNWLVTRIQKCKPWPNAQLSIINESDLPKLLSSSSRRARRRLLQKLGS